MDLLGSNAGPYSKFCEWCFSVCTKRCNRCKAVFYCSKEHQLQHWDIHRKVCKLAAEPQEPLHSNSDKMSKSSYTSLEDWCENNILYNKSEDSSITLSPASFDTDTCSVASEKPVDFNISNEDEIFSSITSELLSSDNNFWSLIESCDTQNMSDYNMFLVKDAIDQLPGSNDDKNFSANVPSSADSSSTADYVPIMQSVSLNDICLNIIRDLNVYGICVLDRFIGTNYGNLILQEVKNMYMTGIFKKGEIVDPGPHVLNENIRSDVTTWVNGTEPNCKHIGSLMRKLDLLVTTCNKMPNNGILSKYKLHRRTKAMIACYPGDGTYYKKHIDNPHRDGRCITCIYYLNQNWDVKTHGGLLRMFPTQNDTQVANIEPVFDRMIFFWSDKRNPHEVLPSFSTRFAITVWYFDADERDQALKMSRNRGIIK